MCAEIVSAQWHAADSNVTLLNRHACPGGGRIGGAITRAGITLLQHPVEVALPNRLSRTLYRIPLLVAVAGCAAIPHRSVAARPDVTCRSGTFVIADPLCEARVGGTTARICALPRRSARLRSLFDAGIFARLDDSSVVEFSVMQSDEDLDAILNDDDAEPNACRMTILAASRTWSLLTDGSHAVGRYRAIATSVVTTGSTTRCGVTESAQGSSFLRVAIADSAATYVSIGRGLVSGAEVARSQAYTETQLRTGKIDLGLMIGQTGRDTTPLLSRYGVSLKRIMWSEAIPPLVTDSGAATCAQREQSYLATLVPR